MNRTLKRILEECGFHEQESSTQFFNTLSGPFMAYKIDSQTIMGITEDYKKMRKYDFKYMLFINDYFQISACTISGLLTDALVSLSLESILLSRSDNICCFDEKVNKSLAETLIIKVIKKLIEEGLK